MNRTWVSVFGVVVSVCVFNVSWAADRSPASYRPTESEPIIKTDAPAEPDLFSPAKETESGFNFAIIYKGEFNTVHSGGLRRRSAYLENLDLRATADLEKIVGLHGGSFFIYGLGNAGGDRDHAPSRNVGDAQVTSNIETATDSFKLYEFWYQQEIGNFSMLFGLHDLNSEFYTTDSSSLFFNSSFGIGKDLSQSGVNGPSIFPTTALSARLRYKPSDNSYVQLGVFNAQAGEPTQPHDTVLRGNVHDGHLYIAEVGYTPEDIGKVALGAWTYSKDFETLDADANDPEMAKSQGVYLLTERKVANNWAIFARYGVASAKTNRFSAGATVGSVWTGVLPLRPKDRFGLGIAQVTNGSTYKSVAAQNSEEVSDTETTFEMNYRIEFHEGVVLQPDLQYVKNPNTDPTIADAFVSAIRIELSY